MNLIWVAIMAFFGGIVSGLLGWCESGQDFIARKFCATVLRSLVAAAGTALAYPFIENLGLVPGLISAFLAGAGVDVLGHRMAGAMIGGMKWARQD